MTSPHQVIIGLNHISREICFQPDFPRNVSRCMSLFGIVLHAVHVMFTCYARVVHVLCVRTGSNRFKPGKTQEKSAPSAVATGYCNSTDRDCAVVLNIDCASAPAPRPS